MKLAQCPKEHYYDADKYLICPHCNVAEDYVTFKSEAGLVNGYIIAKKYTIDHEINRGGYSIVYKGTYKDKTIAIKELFPKGSSRAHDGKNVIMLRKNFELSKYHLLDISKRIRKLEDTGAVPKIYDIVEENDTIYIIMEFLEGYDLSEYILYYSRNIDIKTKKSIMYHALLNLKKIHNKNEFVLDISPSNMFITYDGRVLYLDFGSQYKINGDVANIVTPLFAPPEALNKSGKIGDYTDIYELAAIFFCLLSGKIVDTKIENIISNTNIFKELNINKNIEDALKHALQLKIEDRTQNTKEFIFELFGRNTKEYNNRLDFFPKQLENITHIDCVTEIYTPQKAIYSLTSLGIEPDEIPGVDVNEIINEKQAYNMLLNQFKALDEENNNNLIKINQLEHKMEDRKNSTIMMTIGNIVIASGMAFITTLHPSSIVTLLAGILITFYALYLSFRKKE